MIGQREGIDRIVRDACERRAETGMGAPVQLRMVGAPVVVHRPLFALTGSPGAAVFLSRAIEFTLDSASNAGWFKRTDLEWFDDIRIRRDALESIRRRLVEDGVLDHLAKGLPAASWYRVNLDALQEFLST